MGNAEKKEFKAESKRLLDMMINSIYTHKEIFSVSLFQMQVMQSTNYISNHSQMIVWV